jgi:hypothetical protein
MYFMPCPHGHVVKAREIGANPAGSIRVLTHLFIAMLFDRLRLLLVEVFLRYDTFTADIAKGPAAPTVEFIGVTKASSGPDLA